VLNRLGHTYRVLGPGMRKHLQALVVDSRKVPCSTVPLRQISPGTPVQTSCPTVLEMKVGFGLGLDDQVLIPSHQQPQQGSTAMKRNRNTPPTTSSVRSLAARRGYLLAEEQRSARLFKLISLVGRAVPMPSRDSKNRYSWKLVDADAWLRKQPLLRDR